MRSGALLAASTVLAIACFAPSPVLAQEEVGIRAGVSADPDQFYFGGHIETRPLAERLRFRPNVEVGVGDDVTLIAINLEFAWHFASSRPWHLYLGAGPALNIYNVDRGPNDDDTEADGGFNILIGAQHRGGLFAEFKIGAVDSPDIKLGIGWVLR